MPVHAAVASDVCRDHHAAALSGTPPKLLTRRTTAPAVIQRPAGEMAVLGESEGPE